MGRGGVRSEGLADRGTRFVTRLLPRIAPDIANVLGGEGAASILGELIRQRS